MLAVTGMRTTIIRALAPMIHGDRIERINVDLAHPCCRLTDVPRAMRFVLAAGLLYDKPIREQHAGEIVASLSVNCINVLRLCEMILADQPEARICVIGSESAIQGSYDVTYAAGKAAVHAYVKWKKTAPQQQLVCVSPTIIADSGMTLRRKDYPAVLDRRGTVSAFEVATVIKRVLYDNPPEQVTGCIVRVLPKEEPHGQRQTATP